MILIKIDLIIKDMDTDEQEIDVLDVTPIISDELSFDESGFALAEIEPVLLMIANEISEIESSDYELMFVILRLVEQGAIPIFEYEKETKGNPNYDTRIKLTRTVYGLPAASVQKKTQVELLQRLVLVPAGAVIFVNGLFVPDYIHRRFTWGLTSKVSAEELSGAKYNPTDLRGAPPPVIPLIMGAQTNRIISYKAANSLEHDIFNYIAYFKGFAAVQSRAQFYNQILKDVKQFTPTKREEVKTKFASELLTFVKGFNLPITPTVHTDIIFSDMINRGLYTSFAKYYCEDDKEVLDYDSEDNLIITRSIIPREMYNLREQITISLYEYAYKTLYGLEGFNQLNINCAQIKTIENFKLAIPKDRLKKVEEEVEFIQDMYKIISQNKCPHIPIVQMFYNAKTIDTIIKALHELQEYIKDAKIAKLISEIPAVAKLSPPIDEMLHADTSKIREEMTKEAEREEAKAIDELMMEGGNLSHQESEIFSVGGNNIVSEAVFTVGGCCESHDEEISETPDGLIYGGDKPHIVDSPEAEHDTFLQCKVCKLRLICPHKILAARYQIGQIHKFRDIREVFAKFVYYSMSITEYTLCKICGERLYERDDTMSTIVQGLVIHEADQYELWRDAQRMLNEFVLLEVVLDRNRIIRDMINVCYASIAAKLARLPYEEKADKWREIFARTAYAAYLLNLQANSGGKIKFDYTKYKTTIPISQQKRSKIDIDEYRKRFANKLREIAAYSHAEQKLTWTMVGILFKFALVVYKQPQDEETALKYIPTTAEINHAAKVNSLSAGFAYSKLRTAPRAAKILPDTTPLWRYANEPMPIENMREQNMILIFNKQVKFAQGGKWADPDAGEDNYSNHPSITPEILLKEIKAMDDYIKLREALIRRIPINRTPGSPIKKSHINVSLFALKDADTRKSHKWDTLVYEKDIDGLDKVPHQSINDKVLILKKDASALLLNGAKPIDQYSSTTNMFWSEVQTPRTDGEEDKIREIYRDINNLGSMINYYTHKCPEGETHSYKNNKCTKCGRLQSMRDDERLKYYEKYKKIYEVDKLKIQQTNNVKMETKSITRRSLHSMTLPPLDVYSDEIIQEVASRVGVHINQVRFFGQIHPYKFSEVLLDDFIPAQLLNSDSQAIWIVEGFITDYFLFKLSKKNDFPKFKPMKAILKSYRKRYEPEVLLNWMRMTLYDDFLNYYGINPDEAVQIMISLFQADARYCQPDIVAPTADDGLPEIDDLVSPDELIVEAVEAVAKEEAE